MDKKVVVSMVTHKSCCFIGHRIIDISEGLVQRLKDVVEELICKENVTTFVFGSNSMFNDLCHSVVTDAMKKHPFIKRVLAPCKSEAFTLESDRARQEKKIF